jgi:hypothetical protein
MHTSASKRIQTKCPKLYTTVTLQLREYAMQENEEATHSEDTEKMEISLHHLVTEQELTRNSNII